MKKTTLLKKLILDRDILVMPGAYDALSARIIERTGFKAVSVGGAGCCTVFKGVIPFIMADLVHLVFLIAIPEVSLFWLE